MPPAVMDTKYNGLAVFSVPLSYLQQNLRVKLMFKDASQPGESALPDTI